MKVTIGGKEAKVITVTNDNLYCFVPRGADAGNIEVTVLDGQRRMNLLNWRDR